MGTSAPTLAGPRPTQDKQRDAARHASPRKPDMLDAGRTRLSPGPASSPALSPGVPSPNARVRLQKKLAVGSSADPLEHEADAAAESAAGGHTFVTRRLYAPPVTDAPPIVGRVLRSPGQALDGHTRGWAEPAFQRDFSGVRIHRGPEAEKSAESVQAHAYTVGSSIVFGRDSARSGPEYRRLVAHELAHVVQQGEAAPLDPRARNDAQRASPRVPLAGAGKARVAPQPRASGLLQRYDDTRSKDLGWKEELLVTVASAPAYAVGGTAHDLAHATWHGFIAEVDANGGAAKDKIKDRLVEFIHSPSELLLFFPKYWWGLIKGVFSPITGLFDLAKLVYQVGQIVVTVGKRAWEHSSEIVASGTALAKKMEELGGDAVKAIKGFYDNRLSTAKGLLALIDEISNQATDAAETGGHKIATMLFEAANQPIPDLAETAGEIIGTVVVNIALFVLTDGIGDAILQIATKLGEFSSVLSKLGKGAQALGKIAEVVGGLLGRVGGWIAKLEALIAKAAGVLLKPLSPLLEKFGEVMGSLRTFLRDLLGIAEKAEAQEAAAAAKALAEQAEKPHAPAAANDPHAPAAHPDKPPAKKPATPHHEDAPQQHAPAGDEPHHAPAPVKPAAKPTAPPTTDAPPQAAQPVGPAAPDTAPPRAKVPKKPAPPRPAPGSGPAPQMETAPGIIAEPRTAKTGGITKIKEGRDVFGNKVTDIEGELKPGMNRPTAPNYNKEWLRKDLADDVAASLTARKGMSAAEARAAGEALSKNYEAAHLWGPGFGDEAAAGMMWAPTDVNQMMQNRFAEKFARQLYTEAAAAGGTVRMTASAVPFEREVLLQNGLPGRGEFLEHAQYKITITRPNLPPEEVLITVKADLPGPHASGSIELYPPSMAERFFKIF